MSLIMLFLLDVYLFIFGDNISRFNHFVKACCEETAKLLFKSVM